MATDDAWIYEFLEGSTEQGLGWNNLFRPARARVWSSRLVTTPAPDKLLQQTVVKKKNKQPLAFASPWKAFLIP